MRYPIGSYQADLHSTVVLLKACILTGIEKRLNNLHSTVVLLKGSLDNNNIQCGLYLHST